MNLYLIERTETVTYDENDSMVVAAYTPGEARELAAGVAGDEGEAAWMMAKRSRVNVIGTAKKEKAGVILASFNAG